MHDGLGIKFLQETGIEVAFFGDGRVGAIELRGKYPGIRNCLGPMIRLRGYLTCWLKCKLRRITLPSTADVDDAKRKQASSIIWKFSN